MLRLEKATEHQDLCFEWADQDGADPADVAVFLVALQAAPETTDKVRRFRAHAPDHGDTLTAAEHEIAQDRKQLIELLLLEQIHALRQAKLLDLQGAENAGEIGEPASHLNHRPLLVGPDGPVNHVEVLPGAVIRGPGQIIATAGLALAKPRVHAEQPEQPESLHRTDLSPLEECLVTHSGGQAKQSSDGGMDRVVDSHGISFFHPRSSADTKTYHFSSILSSRHNQ